MEERSERFSLRAGFDAGDLVAGVDSGESSFVLYGVVIVEEHFDDDTEKRLISDMGRQFA